MTTFCFWHFNLTILVTFDYYNLEVETLKSSSRHYNYCIELYSDKENSNVFKCKGYKLARKLGIWLTTSLLGNTRMNILTPKRDSIQYLDYKHIRKLATVIVLTKLCSSKFHTKTTIGDYSTISLVSIVLLCQDVGYYSTISLASIVLLRQDFCADFMNQFMSRWEEKKSYRKEDTLFLSNQFFLEKSLHSS